MNLHFRISRISANLRVSGSARKCERYYLYSPKIITVCEDKISTLPVTLLFECSFLGTSAILRAVFCDSTHIPLSEMRCHWSCDAMQSSMSVFFSLNYFFAKTIDGTFILESILSVQQHRLPNPCFVLKYVALESLLYLG